MADSISAIPQNPYLGKLAQFLRYIETQNKPEFLPPQLDVMGLMAKLALPQASTIENLSYGNYPFTMPPSGTGAMIPQVKTGRKPEVADLVATFGGGIPGSSAIGGATTKVSNAAADALVRAITRNPMATAPQVLEQAAMPFMSAVAPKAPGLLAPRSEMGFYSALEEAVGPLQNKGTGTQFLAQIEKTPGVKPEEIKWTGLDDFLKSRESVTKPEVQDYLAQNRVNLQEVRLGEFQNPYPYQTTQQWEDAIAAAERSGNWDEAGRLNQAWEAFEGYGPAGHTKFSSYTLPGGENYREILLTLPEGSKNPAYKAQKSLDDANKAYDADQSYENYQRVLRAREEADKLGADWKSPEFRSSHFDQPNILAHMRVNDRVVDGKKTLFIEEIQSDWHQAGRKKGYGEKTTYDIMSPDGNWYNQLSDKAIAEQQAAQIGGKVVEKKISGIPDAPFKTTWHELSLKRAIQEASEKGYDRIAFTTGKTQAERYDLSKQISKLSAQHLGAGRYRVDAIDKNGKPAVMKITENEDELEGLIGKEFSKKIIEDTKNKTVGKTYSGLDLQVGGEGMKGFYDQILPKSLEKLGKKFDAKVGKTEMDGVEVWSMDITPKMRESVLTKGQPLFSTIPAAGLLGDEGE